MGKLILISGTNDSGKSAFAEKLAGRIGSELYYIATMIPKTQDNTDRIKKHLYQRKGLGFMTMELPYKVGGAPVTNNSVVLLEDVSNLMANCLFDKRKTSSEVLSDVCALLERCNTLIAVTISDLDGGTYEGETADYIDSLNNLNTELYKRADTAIEIKNRIPRIKKGESGSVY